ncbi:Beta-glucosidase BoGH3B [Bienertia sinuspersici]
MMNHQKIFHVWCMINVLVIATTSLNASKSSAMAETYMKYKDQHQPVEVRVQDLLSRMTLEEKIGQMTQIDITVASFDVMKTYFIGSVLNGGDSAPSPRVRAEDWINIISKFQDGALATRLGIPMFYGIDAVHGNGLVYNSTIFPHNIGLGAARQTQTLLGGLVLQQPWKLELPGFNMPLLLVLPDPRWGRCYESYSEDPQIVQEMTEIIYGLQGEPPKGSQKGFPYVGGRDKVAACAKHFVGDGGTTNGIDESNTVIDAAGLFKIHMPAYLDSIRKGVATIMVSYSSWNGKKMHANRDLVTGYLKNTLKFKGMVISDWEGLDRMTTPDHANYTYSVLTAIQAGIDMIMVPYNFTEFIDILTYLVKNNYIHMERIDDAVKRILRIKFIMGLFENSMADFSNVHELGNQAHRDLAREAVRKSLVLLKNGKERDNPLLPLPKRASKILVAGTHAHNLGYQCGGWTIKWQGFEGNNGTRGTTILDAVKSTVSPDTEVVYKENPDKEFVKSHNFNYAIIVVGELPYAEMHGDSQTLEMLEPGPTMISNVCGAVKCVVVVISGRPVVIEPYIASMDALVAAWLPGTEGQGVSDMLFGDYEFTGKLPRTWFRSVDQLPMNVGDSYYDPLYPFGFGLTTNEIRLSETKPAIEYE